MPKKKHNQDGNAQRHGMGEQVYQILRSQIFERRLVPGTRLNIEKIARDLEVSATPVREAINRMLSDGLATYEPFVGYTLCPPVDRESMLKLLQARKVLETHSARIGAPEIAPAVLRQMQSCTDAMESATEEYRYDSFKVFEDRDNEFHDLIVDSAANPFLHEAYRPIGTRVRMLRVYYSGGPTDMRAVLAEHHLILDAYKRRDGKAAELAVKKHLDAAAKRLHSMIEHFTGSSTKTVRPLRRPRPAGGGSG
jgi:DNA-binding GntR family transcriptional regulator